MRDCTANRWTRGDPRHRPPGAAQRLGDAGLRVTRTVSRPDADLIWYRVVPLTPATAREKARRASTG